MRDLQTYERAGMELSTVIHYDSLESIETALSQPPLSEWAAVAQHDPTATLFQTPAWTLPWYRAYNASFQPSIFAVTSRGRLMGIAPMAIERETGRIAFAGDQMADYRDVVALPAHREEVVREFLKFYRDSCFPNMLWFGPTLPESETVDIIAKFASTLHVPALRRNHYGWRWLAAERDKIEDPLKKKAVRHALNFFRRRGPVTVRVIATESEWNVFKQEFYNQHSLRQLFAGRRTSFDDARKRAFFDDFFNQPPCHVTGLYVNGRMVASHVGAVYRNMLLWGAPSFDIRENAYSPGLLLMVLSMQEAGTWGLKGVDLTIGEGDLKERFSTRRVDLPSVELFPRRRPYFLRKARVAATTYLRAKVTQYGGEKTWTKTLKPIFKKLSQKVDRFHELGTGSSFAQLCRKAVLVVGENTTGIVLIATPASPRIVQPVLQAGESCTFHENQTYDLLKWSGKSKETSWQVSNKVRQLPSLLKSSRTLHTVLVNDRLAGWGLSYTPKEPANLDETGGILLEFLPNSVSLYDFYILPEYRGRKLYQALLSHILELRFQEGAKRAYIGVLDSNLSSLNGIERVGFKRWKINRCVRLFKWKWMSSQVLLGDPA